MTRFGRILLLALLAVWLPATLHCRLEAAGVFAPHDDCADGLTANGGTDCKDDVCPTVEESLYKETAAPLALATPAECFDPCRFALLIAPVFVPTESVLSPARHTPPPELGVTWQFVARAAPPARAPSLNS